jgi:crotonobetainyl-CoA:carnitine CoA-transferase CaiB-like acyl-CoA transferase
MEPRASGSLHPNIAPYGEIILTADGRQVLLAIGNDRQFAGLCEILGISSLVKDPRFIHNKDRLQYRESLAAHILKAASKMNSEEFLKACREKSIPVGEIHSVAESVSHVPDKLVLRCGEMMGIRSFPLLMNQELTPPPVLGADTSQVLTSLADLSADDYRTLADEGIVS